MKKQLTASIFLLLGLLVALSLFSYEGTDPGFFTRSSGDLVKNLCGPFGAYLADFLLGFFGVSIYLLVPALFITSYSLFTKLEKSFSLMILTVVEIILVAAVIGIDFSMISFGKELYPGGGIVGGGIASFLQHYLHAPGAYVLLLGVGLIVLACWEDHRALLVLKQIYLFLKDRKVRKIQKKEDDQETIKIVPLKELKQKENVSPYINIKSRSRVQKTLSTSKRTRKNSDTLQLPDISMLKSFACQESNIDKEELLAKARELEAILRSYKISGRVVEVLPGPVITMYEFEPAFGVKVNQVVNLADDIAMKLRAESIRIIAPIPGKGAIGIEVPNETREIVYFKDVFHSDECISEKKLPLVLGKGIEGAPFTTDLSKMPHLLIAGTTGSGKSVAMNAMISSILFTKIPDEVRFLMIDPKAIEFSSFENIPHLLLPVITDPSKANLALKWVVNEMEKRYRLMLEVNARKLDSFNEKIKSMSAQRLRDLDKKWFFKTNPHSTEEEVPSTFKPLPYIVVVIDELADLMLVAAKEVEVSIARLAQKARASGIHLIVATQRPSTDVITGLIKANFPSRIAFRVASKVDARIILDTTGAETLLGHGDMLFVPPGTSRLTRIHGVYISDEEVDAIAQHWIEQAEPIYLKEEEINNCGGPDSQDEDERTDALFDKAVEIVACSGQASISMLQRKLSIGYNRSAKIIEMMEEKNMIGPSEGSKPRDVYVRPI